MVTCGICHEESLNEIGELDSCDHGFCFACIQHWAQIESKCPFCKARFTTISRKALDMARLPDSDAETGDTLKQRFPGTVLETMQVLERNQVYLGDADWAGDAGEDPLGDVICMECGQGDDEDNLMLCDGCERACHTYCANLDALPEGDWFCWVCMENRNRQLAGEEPVDTAVWIAWKCNKSAVAMTQCKAVSAARRPRRVPSSLVASDFTLPRSRRRASSPGARSERSSRPTRRVRRRLVRSGERLQPGRSARGTQRLDSDANSILNALERSITARDHAGLSTTVEHRRLAGLRGAWNSVRQGQRPFPAGPGRPGVPPVHNSNAAPQGPDPESQAWAAFDASRRAQTRMGARVSHVANNSTAVPSQGRDAPHSPDPIAPGSPLLQRQQAASSLARQAISEARHRGRQLGPTYRPQRAPPPCNFSSSAATVASQRRRAGDQQHGSAAASPLVHEATLNAQGQSSASRGLSQGRRMTHAASRGSLYDRTSSHQQLPERLMQRDSQLPSYPPSSPRLRGADNALESTDSAYVLPVPSSSARSSAPCEHYQCSRSTSSSEQGRAQQTSSLGLPIPYHQQHPQHFPQPWSNPALAAPVHSGAVSCQVQQTHQRQHPYVQRLRPVSCPSPEALPPLPCGPPPNAAADSVPTYRQQAAAIAAAGSRDDSSDSCSSQLASQQHSVRRLPDVRNGRETCSATQAAKSAATKADAKPPDNAQQAESPEHSRQMVGHQTSMTKQQAADAVKALIKPLYVAKGLSKDQFKMVAQRCTHALANANRRLAENSGVREVVRNCLTSMGLRDAAAQL